MGCGQLSVAEGVDAKPLQEPLRSMNFPQNGIRTTIRE